MKCAGLLLCILAAGCKIVALGDSNTCFVHCATNNLWPERMEPLLGWPTPWQIVNRGEAGMMAATLTAPDGEQLRTRWTGHPSGARWHLERILATDLSDPAPCTPIRLAPKLVIALGSNDIMYGRTAEEVATDILALRTRALEAVPCLHVYIALIPPRPLAPRDQAVVNDANQLLRAFVPAERRVPFDLSDEGEIGLDGLHFTFPGQEHRALLAFSALFPSGH